MSCKNIGCQNETMDLEDLCTQCLAKGVASVGTLPNLELQKFQSVPNNLNQQTTSLDFLTAAADIQNQRATQYDQPGGERSMGKIVAMFNLLTDHDLTETEGWKFMELLKLVRSQGNYHEDSYTDRISYASLAAESHLRETQLTDAKENGRVH